MIRDKKVVNKDDYENLAVCIRSDQVPAKDIAEYFEDKVSLFVALAPTVLFKNSKEDFFVEMSEKSYLLNLAVSMDLL